MVVTYLKNKLIQKRIKQLARVLDKDYRNSNDEVVMLCVLKGASVFYHELLRYMKRTDNIVIDFIQVSSYKGTTQSDAFKLKKDIDVSVRNKDVLIVEDIVDTGNTIKYLKNHLRQKHVKTIKVCTLLDKPTKRKCKVKIDYVGFQIPDIFIYGHGLDIDQSLRANKDLQYIKE